MELDSANQKESVEWAGARTRQDSIFLLSRDLLLTIVCLHSLSPPLLSLLLVLVWSSLFVANLPTRNVRNSCGQPVGDRYTYTWTIPLTSDPFDFGWGINFITFSNVCAAVSLAGLPSCFLPSRRLFEVPLRFTHATIMCNENVMYLENACCTALHYTESVSADFSQTGYRGQSKFSPGSQNRFMICMDLTTGNTLKLNIWSS